MVTVMKNDAPQPISLQSGVSIQKLAFTVPEFCAATGIGRTSVYEEIAANRLRAIKAAGRRLITRADAERWLNAHRDAA